MSYAKTWFSMLLQLPLSVGVVASALILNPITELLVRCEFHRRCLFPAFVGVGLISALSTIFFLPLQPDAGTELIGHAMAPHRQLAYSKPSEIRRPGKHGDDAADLIHGLVLPSQKTRPYSPFLWISCVILES
jgi:hypothetical protein